MTDNRSHRQKEIGLLKARLMNNERDVLAGFWVEHSPQYKVIVRLARGGRDIVDRYVAGGSLAGMVEVCTGGVTLDQLQAARAEATRIIGSLGITFNSGMDAPGNRVEMYVTDRARLDAALTAAGTRLPTHVVVEEVPGLVREQVNIYAGLALSNSCTTGFTVRSDVTGETGVLTAGHCTDRGTYYADLILTFMGERYFGHGTGDGFHDVQWYKTPNHTDKPWAKDISTDSTPGYRVIVGAEYWVTQYIGEVVCHYGRITGYGCGKITDDTYDPDGNGPGVARFVRVHNSNGDDLGEGGDSGGPWMAGSAAHGIHQGGWAPSQSPDAVYMPIDYALDWGLSLLTG